MEATLIFLLTRRRPPTAARPPRRSCRIPWCHPAPQKHIESAFFFESVWSIRSCRKGKTTSLPLQTWQGDWDWLICTGGGSGSHTVVQRERAPAAARPPLFAGGPYTCWPAPVEASKGMVAWPRDGEYIGKADGDPLTTVNRGTPRGGGWQQMLDGADR